MPFRGMLIKTFREGSFMCTCITYKNGDFYFGRNMDLEYSFGEGEVFILGIFRFLFGIRGFFLLIMP